jgi:hypothetical protein
MSTLSIREGPSNTSVKLRDCRQPSPWNYFLLARYTEIISNLGRHPSTTFLLGFLSHPRLGAAAQSLGLSISEYIRAKAVGPRGASIATLARGGDRQ